MAAEATAVVGAGQLRRADDARRRIAYMRYVGQGHEIPVPLPARRADGGRRGGDPRRATTRNTRRFYDRPVPGSDVEIMSYAVVVATVRRRLAPAAAGERAGAAGRTGAHAAGARHRRPARSRRWAVYDRAALAPGATLRRPGDHRRGRDVHPGRPGLDARAIERAAAISN